MTDKSTVLDTNPWDTADESPAPKAKVVDFTTKIAKMQNAGDNFNGFYKIIIGILLFLWLISGFYQILPCKQCVFISL